MREGREVESWGGLRAQGLRRTILGGGGGFVDHPLVRELQRAEPFGGVEAAGHDRAPGQESFVGAIAAEQVCAPTCAGEGLLFAELVQRNAHLAAPQLCFRVDVDSGVEPAIPGKILLGEVDDHYIEALIGWGGLEFGVAADIGVGGADERFDDIAIPEALGALGELVAFAAGLRWFESG